MRPISMLHQNLAGVCLLLALFLANSLVAMAAGADAAPAVGEITLPNSHATIRGQLKPGVIAPGGKGTLVLTAVPSPGYRIYALGDEGRGGIARPTLIHFTETANLKFGEPVADRRPKEKPEANPADGVARYYEEAITWTVSVEAPADVAVGSHLIEGVFAYQICFSNSCERPIAVRFAGSLNIAAEAGTETETPLTFTPASYSAAEPKKSTPEPTISATTAAVGPLFGGLKPIEANATTDQNSSLLLVLSAALVGGFILNFMPCVLPVIGLKVLSFVNQAGNNRAQAFALNGWFSAGLISVFLVLAGLAAFFQLGWGEQFSSTGFNIAMAGLVFAMALSFLGVWEIPIPGFVGSGKATELESREGAIGAFSKGVITTVLSTPCSGPFLGPVFGFTLKQSTPMIFLIFFFVGLGMASPYLLIGAFPRLVKFLPKPGAWMDTFKQIMGFFLLGTVVFLFTFTDKNYLPATFCMLVGIWAACWWIGRTPLTAELGTKLLAWSQAIGVAGLVAAMGFYLFVPHDTAIAWQPYSREALERQIAEGRTVLVDFTADWCPTCKANEWLVLNTESVSTLVNRNHVVPMVADWTDGSDEIKDVLEQLGSKSIPVYAIFSANRPNEPIVLRDLVTKNQVISALNAAGPSKTAGVAVVGR